MSVLSDLWSGVWFNKLFVALATVLLGARAQYVSSECSEQKDLSVFVGQDVVLSKKVPVAEIVNIFSDNSPLFEFMDGKLTKNCFKCVFVNSSSILKNIQLNESGVYYIKDGFVPGTCINITVLPTTTPDPKVPPNGTTPDPTAAKNSTRFADSAAIIVGVIVAVVVVVAAVAVCIHLRSGRVKRETGTSSSTTNNLTKQQDEDTDLLHSKNQDDIVITMSNGATSTDPC
ncbi:uncharacterized protein LOC121396871 isoform X2 [Xenopus laevis]|uniref:Uncharacterized protein LOC121396871 isoform X2 n=1 Tax=Xenopus laevis TaxID=8355 RepID=A0A8J1LFM2_XENLA|nr:uncharacterized protein LOC121396871 isoform X2 [Xenopus laevis]